MAELKILLKKVLPTRLYNLLRAIKTWRYWRDVKPCMQFLLNGNMTASLSNRLGIIKQLYVISHRIDSPHNQEEILSFIKAILSLPPDSRGVIVEAGCYKGSSTAKFSLAANIVGKKLVVLDSFQGIPENIEPHDKTIFGGRSSFKQGAYCGTLDEVIANVSKYGRIASCRFVEGWFEDTLPTFKEPISAIYLDVDLVSSTHTCLKYLYPLLEPGGVLFSQDGHLPLVIDLFDSDRFWLDEIGCKKPTVFGLGKKKLINIVKSKKPYKTCYT